MPVKRSKDQVRVWKF